MSDLYKSFYFQWRDIILLEIERFTIIPPANNRSELVVDLELAPTSPSIDWIEACIKRASAPDAATRDEFHDDVGPLLISQLPHLVLDPWQYSIRLHIQRPVGGPGDYILSGGTSDAMVAPVKDTTTSRPSPQLPEWLWPLAKKT